MELDNSIIKVSLKRAFSTKKQKDLQFLERCETNKKKTRDRPYEHIVFFGCIWLQHRIGLGSNFKVPTGYELHLGVPRF